MAANRKKPTTKQVKILMRVSNYAFFGTVPDCQSLFEAAEVIQQLIAENCPIARQPMRQAKKKAIKK
jgi:hypothetical protein